MFCYRCGYEIDDDSKFCPMCGAPMERDLGNSRKGPDRWYEETQPIASDRPVERGWQGADNQGVTAGNLAGNTAGNPVGNTAGNTVVRGSNKRWIPIVVIAAVLVGGFLIFNLLREPIVGTWTATERQEYGETYDQLGESGISITATFSKDHTFLMTVYSESMEYSYSFNGFWEKTAKGEYSVTVYDDGDTIYFKTILKGKTLSMYEDGYEEDVVIFRKN